MHALLATVGIIAIIVVTFTKLNLRPVLLKRSARPDASPTPGANDPAVWSHAGMLRGSLHD